LVGSLEKKLKLAKDLIAGYFGLRVEDGPASTFGNNVQGGWIAGQVFHVLSPTDVTIFDCQLWWDKEENVCFQGGYGVWAENLSYEVKRLNQSWQCARGTC
jgi:hypothetical protein